MTNTDAAVMAMILSCVVGFLLSDGELRRVKWIQAMRRCLLRMNWLIRYEQPPLHVLLKRIDLRSTPQERELTKLLHACAGRVEKSINPQLMLLFAGETARLPAYGVLSHEDRAAFEGLLGDLGRTCLGEQIVLIDGAEERLRAREEELACICRRRAQLMRMLGASAGAALFLILI